MKTGLFRSLATVGGLTLVSRVLGFLRDVVFANQFGVGPATDAFFVAFKIPNFMRRLFGEGAFAQAFVPVLSEYRTQRPHAEVRELIGAVSGTLGGVLLALTAAALVAAPVLVAVFAPGFLDEPARFDLTAEMLRLTFPYLFFISLTALAGGVLNAYGRFDVPAFTPVLLNLCFIAAALLWAERFEPPVMALAWAVFAAGLLQLLFQLPFLARLGLLTRPRWGWGDAGVKRVVRLMIPALFGSSVAQINLLLDTLIASLLAAGSVSWLYYSDRLVEFPLGVFGIALATVILPNLSRHHAEASADRFTRTMDWSLRWVLLLGTPAMLGLMLLAAPILATLFHYGAFADRDVEMAALSLVAYGAGLPGFILVKVLAPGFYARQDTRTPMRIGVVAMVTNMGLNLAFVVPMVQLGLPGPHAGLALATGVAAFVNAGLLFRGLRREGVFRAQPGWGRFVLQALVANAVMAALLWSGRGETAWWLAADLVPRVVRLLALVGAGAGAYFLVLTLFGFRLRQLRSPGP